MANRASKTTSHAAQVSVSHALVITALLGAAVPLTHYGASVAQSVFGSTHGDRRADSGSTVPALGSDAMAMAGSVIRRTGELARAGKVRQHVREIASAPRAERAALLRGYTRGLIEGGGQPALAEMLAEIDELSPPDRALMHAHVAKVVRNHWHEALEALQTVDVTPVRRQGVHFADSLIEMWELTESWNYSNAPLRFRDLLVAKAGELAGATQDRVLIAFADISKNDRDTVKQIAGVATSPRILLRLAQGTDDLQLWTRAIDAAKARGLGWDTVLQHDGPPEAILEQFFGELDDMFEPARANLLSRVTARLVELEQTEQLIAQIDRISPKYSVVKAALRVKTAEALGASNANATRLYTQALDELELPSAKNADLTAFGVLSDFTPLDTLEKLVNAPVSDRLRQRVASELARVDGGEGFDRGLLKLAIMAVPGAYDLALDSAVQIRSDLRQYEALKALAETRPAERARWERLVWASENVSTRYRAKHLVNVAYNLPSDASRETRVSWRVLLEEVDRLAEITPAVRRDALLAIKALDRAPQTAAAFLDALLDLEP